jgi:hypothetical protein
MIMDDKHFFTVEEANRLIPQIQRLVERLRQGQQRLRSHRPTAEAIAQKASGNGGGRDAGAYLSDYSHSFGGSLAELQALGVVLKDLEQGLIDFPTGAQGVRCIYVGSMVKRAFTTGMRPMLATRDASPSKRGSPAASGLRFGLHPG